MTKVQELENLLSGTPARVEMLARKAEKSRKVKMRLNPEQIKIYRQDPEVAKAIKGLAAQRVFSYSSVCVGFVCAFLLVTWFSTTGVRHPSAGEFAGLLFVSSFVCLLTWFFLHVLCLVVFFQPGEWEAKHQMVSAEDLWGLVFRKDCTCTVSGEINSSMLPDSMLDLLPSDPKRSTKFMLTAIEAAEKELVGEGSELGAIKLRADARVASVEKTVNGLSKSGRQVYGDGFDSSDVAGVVASLQRTLAQNKDFAGRVDGEIARVSECFDRIRNAVTPILDLAGHAEYAVQFCDKTKGEMLHDSLRLDNVMEGVVERLQGVIAAASVMACAPNDNDFEAGYAKLTANVTSLSDSLNRTPQLRIGTSALADLAEATSVAGGSIKMSAKA